LRLPPQAAGTYWLIAYIDSCRSLADTVVIRRNEIEANFVFSPDTGYAPAKISFVNRSTGDGLSSFQWDFGDGYQSAEASPAHVYRQPGEYTVRLVATNSITGCADTLDYNYVIIDSVVMFIPNAFTPNSDGINDFFKVTDRNFETFSIWIYNRWGQLVFQSMDPRFGWDGKLNGENLPSGSYPYLIRGMGKNAKPFQYEGEIRLIR
jgi:gliding motility-associated-like protein